MSDQPEETMRGPTAPDVPEPASATEALDLDAIQARADAASEGPWAWEQTAEKGYGAMVATGCFAEDDEDCEHPLSGDLGTRTDDFYVEQAVAEMGHQKAGPDAAFIAHARTDVPALIAEVRRLQQREQQARAEGVAEGREQGLRESVCHDCRQGIIYSDGRHYRDEIDAAARCGGWPCRAQAIRALSSPAPTGGGHREI